MLEKLHPQLLEQIINIRHKELIGKQNFDRSE